MAKRFIDTKMFEDEWFSELSKDAKLFFIYFITTCDHAGMFRLNKKLLEFQTGIKNFDTVRQELGKCLVTVKEGLFFMPKYIKFQYPNFPNSTVKQQDSALKILKGYGLLNSESNSYERVSQELSNYYVNDSVIVNDEYKEDQIEKSSGNTLFKNSIYFDKAKFKESFPDWSNEKLKHYYESALDWSESKGKLMKDWKATIRGWARKDENEGKITFNKPKVSSGLQFGLM